MEFVVKNEILNTVKYMFRKTEYAQEVITFNVNSPDADTISVDENSVYFLVSKSIDIPSSAVITISSQTNFFKTTFDEFQAKSDFIIEKFRGNNIVVTVKNYGVSFTPFNLIFLKITPFTIE